MKCNGGCGQELTSGDVNGLCFACRNKTKTVSWGTYPFPSPFPMPTGPTGWICPVCGRGNSPSTGTCPCKPIQWTITY